MEQEVVSQTTLETMHEQLRALTQLQGLSRKLNASLSLDQTLDAVIDAAITICRTDRAAISYFDEAGELILIRHRGLSAQYVENRRLSRREPSLIALVEKGLPGIVEDVEELAGISPNYEYWKAEGVRSIVTLPLVSEGAVFGVLGAGSREVRRYSEVEIDAMTILATEAGAAITNARLFEKLKEANRAKDEFLATLSHELRTPLTPIMGWVNVLKDLKKLDPLLAEGLEVIERNAKQQAVLINDLLDLTRIISGKIELFREATDLVSIAKAAAEQIRPQAGDRSIEVATDLPPIAVTCDLDPLRIQQVITNLLGNALKFTPEGGRIELRLHGNERGEGNALLEVIDNGLGIEPAFLPHIFERFTQAHGSLDRRYGGLGLGLAITRSLVEMHGGRISAESAGIGLGSSFRVTLPVGMPAPLTETAGNRETSLSSKNDESPDDLGLRLLVIEDSQDARNVMELILSTYGCDVETASNASDGIKLAVEHKPHIIISDIGMPGLDGYEFIRRIRATPGLENTPAIALTGYAREEDREFALEAGYDAHLAKPADLPRLLSLIRRLTKGE
ncbi:MAG: hybrid sensor histidine kinase/response regulator [Blastocatellia bacterium AA13]|nr:MAG: hybrid sensor histidine kinase/response regulator [Blastocatellia bacterium AA13]